MAGLTDLFADTVRETSETALGGKNGYRNLVQQAHYTSNFLVGGKTDEEMLHTGQTIRDTLYLKSENVGKRFGGAGLRFDYDNKQVGTKVTTQMSFYATYLAWDEVELDLNADSSMGKEYIRAKFNDILKGKYQNLTQTQADQFEGEMWAVANQADMRTNFAAPMSIPYYLTEQTTGFPIQGGGAASMTDVLGLSPTTYDKWKNQTVTYDAYGGDADDGNDLIGSLIYAAQISHFEPLPFNPEYGVMESVPNVVFCSDTGLRVVTAALRAGQDTWGQRELTHMGVTLDNMVFRNITALNTAALYSANAVTSDAATVAYAESAASGIHADGPRYYGVSKKAMNPMFMRDRYMKAGDVTDLTAVGKPNEFVQVFKTYNQLVCTDRSKCFVVSPAAAL